MHLWKKETQFGKENRIKNKRILMVCLGNICRSPLAQGAMEFLAKKNSLKIFVDSAGTEAWHTGQSPDQRAQKVAIAKSWDCLLYTSPSPRDRQKSRMPSSA